MASSRWLRRVSGVMVMALAVGSATVVGEPGLAVAVTAAKASAAAPEAAVFGPAQAQDEASARLMARLQNRQIEVLGARTDASQTFVGPDGLLTLSAFAEPRWVKRGGAWVDLDATLQAGPGGTVVPAASESPLVLSGGGSGALVSMTVDGKKTLLTWPSALPKPMLSGTTATYRDVLDGVDLQVTATVAGGAEETLVVKTAEAAADPALADLVQTVATATETTVTTDTGGNLTVKDTGGHALVTSPAPVMWDSATTAEAIAPKAGPTATTFKEAGTADTQAKKQAAGTRSGPRGPGSHAHQAPVKARLESHKLHLTVDRALLTAKNTVFPVYVDPAYVPHPASGSTLHFDEVQQAYPTTSNWDSAPSNGLALGYQGFSSPTGIERTYYTLSVPSTIFGTKILSATLNTKVTYAASSVSNSTTVNAFSTSGIGTATTWNNQPDKQTGGTNPNYPSPNASATFTTTSQSPNQSVKFDVTSGMQYLAGISHSPWTLGLFNATETDSNDFVRFAPNPTFSITYDHAPTTPSALAVSQGATAGYTASHTPTFSATSTDADSDTVRQDFQVLSGSTVVASGSSAFANSGLAGTWADTTSLADGSYTWKVRAYDGSQYSAWSAAQNLKVDTTAPANTAVSSNDFPSNTWSGTQDADGNFNGKFTVTPPSSDVAAVTWTLDSGTWTSTATTGAAFTKTLTFPAGRHQISVKTVDAAGNLASGAWYVFYAGSGAALTSPGEGERPARRVALMAQGQSSYTGVTYQYRVGVTDSWHGIPANTVTVNSTGAKLTAWPVALTVSGGLAVPPALTWNVADSLADGPVDVRAYFTDGTTPGASPANTITVDRNSGTAPTEQVGPGSVNTLTGDFTVSATDVTVFGQTVSRTASSRRPTAGTDTAGQVPIYGPQWTAGTAAELTDSDWANVHKVTDTSVGLTDVEGMLTGFTATTSGGWKPEPGSDDLTLTSKDKDGHATNALADVTDFTLKDDQGATTIFARVSGTYTWLVSTTKLPTANSDTTVVPEGVPAGGGVTLSRPKYLIAPTTAVSADKCQGAIDAATTGHSDSFANTATNTGCRVLQFVYATTTSATTSAFGDYNGRLSQIKLWAVTPGSSTTTASVIAQYAYDDSGRLREAWDPRTSPNLLKTTYAYDSAGRITTLTPPGELPWTVTYKGGSDTDPDSGRLWSASRPNLVQGSKSTLDGTTATSSVVYNVPLTDAKAPNAMGSADVSAWGQTDVPTDATAIFPAAISSDDYVPTSHTGADLVKENYKQATVTYTDASGREVNTATPGGHITTTEYDQFGNTIRELTAANRELALTSATTGRAYDELSLLRIAGKTTSERAELLTTRSEYSPDGLRETDEYGPLHEVILTSALQAEPGGTDLPAGTYVPARTHTVNTYDEGRPTDGTATVANQATTSQVGAFVDELHPDGEVRGTKTEYDWVKGLPTSTSTSFALTLTTNTSYDAQGRVTKSTLPKSDGTDAGTSVITYYSATGTGPCQGRPEWADLVCTTGSAGAITGGGSNPAQLPTSTTEYDRWGNVAKITEAVGTTTRTTTTQYDSAGRGIRTSVSGGLGTAVPDATTAYDTNSGEVASVTSNGRTVTHTYDVLGREISYADGSGNTTAVAYDGLGRPVKSTDSAPSTTTFTYDTSADPRGLPTSRTDSVAGTFEATYDADGELATESLPGGYTLSVTRDETSAPVSRIYSRDSDHAIVATDTINRSAQNQVAREVNTNGQSHSRSYIYDSVGRLARADEVNPDGSCSRREYSFDDNSNRKALTTSTSAAGDDCTSNGATVLSYTYDSADRLTASGTVYDAFGRTVTQASGATINYYADDMVRQRITGGSRSTWTLDAVGRLAAWTTELQGGDGAWTQVGAKKNHYGGDGDSPVWVEEDSNGTITRNVHGLSAGLEATTGATGNTILQLTDIHGDVTVQLPLDSAGTPSALAYDEYGNLSSDSANARYAWLGATQRASDAAGGLISMGVRLYDPTVGRFLTRDSEADGGANAYSYCSGDPVNCSDPTGLFDYEITYRIGWSKVSASRFFGFVKANFGAVFPIAGHPNKLPGVGTRINLHVGPAPFPVRVASMNSHYWKFDTLKGHPDYPGYISFDFKKKKNGDMTLTVHGHSRFSIMDFIVGGANYEKVATETWVKFVRKLQTLNNQINHYY
ncbi:RHS repeat-associated core domain-containing protein [Streptomyces sp. NPDC046977]|uniref:RHS repeat-associated core domain-containing protein n=1 Tax=Streptomyces sp. NPDC046977 TaxID=3154703 RepID=UPI0033E24092